MDERRGDHAVGEAQRDVQHGEQGRPAEHVERPERLPRQGVHHREPEPDAGRDDDAESGAFAQGIVFVSVGHDQKPPCRGQLLVHGRGEGGPSREGAGYKSQPMRGPITFFIY
jgi:hypothetical protein